MLSKVLLADDHGIVRQGVRSLLERQMGFEVVAEASDGVETLLLVRKLRPDVVIIDVTMSNLNAVEATQQMLKEFPDMKVVALSEHAREGFVREIFDAGVCSYILKDGLFEELIDSLKIVLEGGVYLSPGVTGVEIDDYVN